MITVWDVLVRPTVSGLARERSRTGRVML
jgi:hypothetical protein